MRSSIISSCSLLLPLSRLPNVSSGITKNVMSSSSSIMNKSNDDCMPKIFFASYFCCISSLHKFVAWFAFTFCIFVSDFFFSVWVCHSRSHTVSHQPEYESKRKKKLSAVNVIASICCMCEAKKKNQKKPTEVKCETTAKKLNWKKYRHCTISYFVLTMVSRPSWEPPFNGTHSAEDTFTQNAHSKWTLSNASFLSLLLTLSIYARNTITTQTPTEWFKFIAFYISSLMQFIRCILEMMFVSFVALCVSRNASYHFVYSLIRRSRGIDVIKLRNRKFTDTVSAYKTNAK